MDISDEDIDALVGITTPKKEKPKPSTVEKWVGHGTLLGRLGETLDRAANVARTGLSAAKKGFSGKSQEAGEDIINAARGLPGALGGAVDVVGERFGAPSLQDKIDEETGFDPAADRTSGQDVLKEYGLIKRSDNPLLSVPGAAGFALEAVVDPLHIPAVAKLTGAPVKAAIKGAEYMVDNTALLKGLKRGPVEAASAAADRAKHIIQKEGLLEEGLRRRLLDVKQAGGDTAQLETELASLASKYNPPGVSREARLKSLEQQMGQNVGTGSVQITPENEEFFKQFQHNDVAAVPILEGINTARQAAGKELLPFDQFDPKDINRMKQIIDKSGLPPDKINDIFEGVTGKRPLTEDPITQLRMRMFQHANAVGMNKFSGDLIASKTAYQAPVNNAQLHFIKEGISAFYDHLGARRYMVDGLTHNGVPLIFADADNAQRARDVFSYIRPQTLGASSVPEKLLKVYDDFNKMMKYGQTQPFPQYAIMNKATNRMTANLAGDVPVVGQHYSIANQVMSGAGYDKTFKVKAKQLGADGNPALDPVTKNPIEVDVEFTGKQLVEEFQNAGGSALPNINPALNKTVELPRTGEGVMGKANEYLQKVGKPFERASATMVGAPMVASNPAIAGQVTNSMLEEADRLGVYIYNRMQGLDPKTAVARADAVLGNQSSAALNPAERQFAQRGVLFYNYTRNVIPVMLKAFAEKPGAFNLVLKADRQPKEEEPSYIDKGISVDLEGPGTTLSNIPNPIENITKQFGGESPMSLLSPLPRAIMEQQFGKSALTGKELTKKAPGYLPEALTVKDKSGQAQTALPGLTQLGVEPQTQNQLLQNNPLSRALNLADYMTKPQTTAGDIALNLTTAMKVNRFDPTSTHLYNQAEQHKQLLDKYTASGAVAKGAFGYTINPNVVKTLPPDEAAQLMNAYAQYNKLVRAGGKAKKAANAKLQQ